MRAVQSHLSSALNPPAHLFIVLVARLWGTPGLLGRLAAGVEAPPLGVASARMVVTGLALAPFARRGGTSGAPWSPLACCWPRWPICCSSAAPAAWPS